MRTFFNIEFIKESTSSDFTHRRNLVLNLLSTCATNYRECRHLVSEQHFLTDIASVINHGEVSTTIVAIRFIVSLIKLDDKTLHRYDFSFTEKKHEL